MLKHILHFRLKEKAGGQNKEENLRKLKHSLEALRETIPELLKIEVGINESQGPSHADLSLYTEFANLAALERYRIHPEHQKVLLLINEVCRERSVVDYHT